MGDFNFKTYFYPGKTFSDERLSRLTAELRAVAAVCFDECPDYQALTGKREELSRAIITTARNKEGKLMGFVSALMLEDEYEENFLHLGLTCARPEARGKKLTHKLTSKTLLKVLMRRSPFSSLWISNCACVLSSLGNVALYFEELSPSPYGPREPSFRHLRIARSISKNYRGPIAISENARLNEEKLVFEGSVPGTIFAKDPSDSRFYHRSAAITDYYLKLLDFERGDEAIQIGRVSILTFPKYVLKRMSRKRPGGAPQLAQA